MRTNKSKVDNHTETQDGSKPKTREFLGSIENDTITGSSKGDFIRGFSGNDQLFGGNGKDTLVGDEGDDLLQGVRGNDILNGGVGNDRIEGGQGDDLAILDGSLADFEFMLDSSTGEYRLSRQIDNTLETDILSNVERVQFNDGSEVAWIADSSLIKLDLVESFDSGLSKTDNLTNLKQIAIHVELGQNRFVGDSVNLFLNGIKISTVILESSHLQAGYVIFDINLESMPDGAKTFTSSIVNFLGQTSALSSGLTINLDTSADVQQDLNIALPMEISQTTSAQTLIVVSGLDSDSTGVLAVSDSSGKSVLANVSMNGEILMDFSDLMPGELIAKLRIVDAAGNSAELIRKLALISNPDNPDDPQNPIVFISEIHYNNTGPDSGEAIGIQGTAGTDLTGWTLILYSGADGLAYNTISLTDLILMNEGNGFGEVSVSAIGLQNGSPDGLALVDSTGNVVEFLSYGGSFTANDGAAIGMQSTPIPVFESEATPVGTSLQKIDGEWFANQPQSFGVINKLTPLDPNDPNDPLDPQDPVDPKVYPLSISEIHYDNEGFDMGEAIAIQGTANLDLTGWKLELYNGKFQTLYQTVNLDGIMIDDEGQGFGEISIGINNIQNGALSGDPIGTPGDAIALVDNQGTVIQFLSYEGAFTALNGSAANMTSIDIGVTESDATLLGSSIELIGTSWQITVDDSFGSLNV